MGLNKIMHFNARKEDKCNKCYAKIYKSKTSLFLQYEYSRYSQRKNTYEAGKHPLSGFDVKTGGIIGEDVARFYRTKQQKEYMRVGN